MKALDVVEALIPILERFFVHGAEMGGPDGESAIRWPPMKPPAPQTRILKLMCVKCFLGKERGNLLGTLRLFKRILAQSAELAAQGAQGKVGLLTR